MFFIIIQDKILEDGSAVRLGQADGHTGPACQVQRRVNPINKGLEKTGNQAKIP